MIAIEKKRQKLCEGGKKGEKKKKRRDRRSEVNCESSKYARPVTET